MASSGSERDLWATIIDKIRETAPKSNSPQWQYVAAEEGPRIGRQEILVKLFSTCVGLAVSLTISYFGIKWLANAMDPTRQEKKEAQKRVCILICAKICIAGIELTIIDHHVQRYEHR